ncbi:RNA polymerase sigma factor [bacterium]|nr:RNA polymerase sigma factor [candidate division CSSED10-310 bacterium]
MDYDEIGELIGEIKFRYVQTGEWDSGQCTKLLQLTQHVPMMVGRKRGVSFDDLNDIVQQSYHAAFKYLHLLSDDRSFPKYLYTIADNLCRKYWKKRIKMGYPESLEFPDGHAKALEPVQMDYEQMHIRENLRDAVSQLPDIYRETIEMHYFAGMKALEIAETLHISINTVTSRIRRGRILLKDILEA